MTQEVLSKFISTQTEREEKIKLLEDKFQEILDILEIKKPSTEKTPQRIARMYIDELFYGLDKNNFPKLCMEDAPNQELIVVRKIRVKSLCEHHFLPFEGYADIAYLPNQKIIGLSKINRIVDYFCKRPQLQEGLTEEIAQCLKDSLETPHLAVFIRAKHFCVSMRGIEDECSYTETQKTMGAFENDHELRQIFFQKTHSF